MIGPYLYSLVVDSFAISDEHYAFKYADDFTMCAILLKNSPNDHVKHIL